MNIATKTFKDFVIALKQASTKGFNKPVQINYKHSYFLAVVEEGETVGYKEKLNKLSGDETDHLFDVMNGLLEWGAAGAASVTDVTSKVVVDKLLESVSMKLEASVETPSSAVSTGEETRESGVEVSVVKPRANSRKRNKKQGEYL